MAVVQVPFNGFLDAAFEGLLRLPAQFTAYFCGVYRVSAVVAGAVFDEGDLRFVFCAVMLWAHLVQYGAYSLYYLDVLHLMVAADVVGLAALSVCHYGAERSAVVFHVEPVADVFAVAVDGQRLAGERVVDDERDEFFRELARAVVVGAVGGEHGKAIGVEPRADEVVGRCFGGGVG